MIDIKLLQKDFDYVVKALQKKGVDNALLNNLKDLALKTKQKRQEMEDVIAEQNLLSKEFGRYKKENLDISELQEKINALKTKKQELEDEVRTLEDDLNSIILSVPNMPDENVPFGVDENENVILEVIGEKPTFNFTPKEHWDLSCDWLDFERGVKLAKSRFTAIKGDGARLE
ncbi:serine--tRNA ligase, partial [Aliarcobacter butzleri]|nr:serine--tRNA ligase [Aliarcobacter butzleri]